MDLTLSGELAQQVLGMTRKDNKLALALAQQFLGAIEPTVLAGYLLTREVALDLLAERIRKNPEETLRALQRMPVLDVDLRRKTAAPLRGKPGRKAAAAPKAGRRKRQRLTAQRVDQIKNAVKSFLARHPWSNRKQISSAVSFPSLGIYNRIMGELRGEGTIVAQGEKAKTVYAVKGSARAKAAPKATRGRAKAKAVKKGPPKTGAAKKAKATAKPTAKAKAKTKTAKKTRAPRQPLLCPFPGCKNKGAPVFGMMCKEHKEIPKEERLRLFAERRQAQAQ